MNMSTRRDFLKRSSLTFAFSLAPLLPAAAQAPARAVLPGSLNTNRLLDSWLRINPNGTVTMFTGKVELGQGILTALTQIVADELDVDLKRLEVISGNTALAPDEGVTSGSLSIQDSGTALRFACAEARGMLLQTASVRLGVAVNELQISDGNIFVSNAGTARTSYWDIASETSFKREATAKTAPKPSSQHRLIGQSVTRRDIPAKVTGGEAYVQDVRLPGMVHGRVVRPGAPRARLLAVDIAAVQRMPGVLAVVRDGSFLAVAARREEQAIAAARALQASARWDEPGDLPPSDAALFKYMQKQRTQDTVVSEKKDAAASGRPVTTIKAEYTRPYQAHASIGPSCALAQWSDGKLRVWCHSQGVFPLRSDMAKVLRMPPTDIVIMHREGSGCYGHNGADDVALDAALLARAIPGVPVRLQWMREDEFGWEPLGSPMVIQMRASVDADGKVADWQHELWSFTHSTRPNDPEGSNLLASWYLKEPLLPGPSRNIPQPSGGSDRNAIPLYSFPQQKVVNHLLLDLPIRTSALRTLGAYANVFALESFMDELAGVAGADAVEFRLAHLTDIRGRAVIERAAGMANLQRAAAPDTRSIRTTIKEGVLKGRGIGFAKYKNLAVYCAVIVDIAVDTRSGTLQVERAWSAVDAGLVVNPNGLRNQIEGGIIQSTSWSLYESAAHDGRHLLARNWPDYRILRFPEVPSVQVELINRPDERSLGVGEGAHGPTVAAIANAFANATGRRLRDLPFTAERIKQTLA
jgi:nicotinate dehydrogenase subunit B